MLELWAKSKETKKISFIQYIKEEEEFYALDNIDPNLFTEAIIVRRNEDNTLSGVNYRKYETSKTLSRRK